MKAVADMGEGEAKKELKSTVDARETLLKDLKGVIEKYTHLHTQLRRQERTLSIQANQHMKQMRAMETQIKAIHDYLTRSKEMHGKMLGAITQPSWAVAHHYHMTSIEHTMGHTQPHILEVGDMIRGHHHIYAMANCTTHYRKQAELHLRKANNDRAKAADKVKQVYGKLRKVRSSIIKSLKILNTATKTVGTNRLDIGKTQNKKASEAKKLATHRPTGNRNNYLHLKMRYLSSLNIDQNVEVTSSMAQADEGKIDEGPVTEITLDQEKAFESDLDGLNKMLSKYTKLTLRKRRIDRRLKSLRGPEGSNDDGESGTVSGHVAMSKSGSSVDTET
ncbi:hypothetical protein AAMO2058_000556200 [Amorphochlora amoebiformis]|mmetsp:Transcript_26863/g.42628  ORF Transcript_26863/g.42628 Transcript_26863/m.42628 type:complete len:334 (-) Transcript_26863:214-1215(-)